MATPTKVEQGDSASPKTERPAPAQSIPHVAELCKRIGLPNSTRTFAEIGRLTLQFDSMIINFVSHVPHSISATCYVGELGKNENVKKLLELNFLPGVSRFAMEPNSDTRVVSVHDWNTSQISPEEFYTGVEEFVNRTEKGQKLLLSK